MDQSSLLLIGKNGSGKTTVALTLRVLQQIARGKNRVGDLVSPKDLARKNAEVPIRFELEVELEARIYQYNIAFEFPNTFKELRVREENMALGGKPVYSRDVAEVHPFKEGRDKEAEFRIDWHLVALPLIQQQSPNDPLFIFRQWPSTASNQITSRIWIVSENDSWFC